MKKISKKEAFRIKKRREKLRKKVILWGSVCLVATFVFYLILNSNKGGYNYPKVDKDLVPKQTIHWHPKLEIIIEGKKIKIPNNIGISSNYHSPTHTHEEGDGTIHIENSNPSLNPNTMSLGYFFYLWKKPFNSTCILDKCIDKAGGEIHMYVNGKENFDFEKYVFRGDERIKIVYNSNK